MPVLLNMRRRRGVVPPGAVYIGRENRVGLRRSKWANPFPIEKDGHPDRDDVIAWFEEWLFGRRPSPPGWRVDPAELLAALPELRGRDLACWCAPDRCHGEVLLKLANG